MAITKNQRIAMAVIVLTGLLAGGGLLLTERHKTGEEAEQAIASLNRTTVSGKIVSVSPVVYDPAPHASWSHSRNA